MTEGARVDVVFASGNAGKLRELDALLAPLGYRARAQGEYGIEPVEETATTFVENALAKARHATRVAGVAAIADDSGLEVDALGGAPGLHSARHAERHGRGSGDAANNALLLEQLAGVEPARRTARFRSVVVLLGHALDPSPIIAEGVWEGHVLEAPVPGGGFGYDPLFRSDDTGVAASLLPPERKNRLSHRGQAVAALLARLAARPAPALGPPPGSGRPPSGSRPPAGSDGDGSSRDARTPDAPPPESGAPRADR